MVSKIAVMALVAVVAVPILLGYGLNIQTESYSGWEEDGQTNNYTNYLASIEDATKRNYTDADIYQFNSKIFNANAVDQFPVYQKVSTTRTPVNNEQQYFTTSGSQLIRMNEYYSQGTIDGGYDATNYYSLTITLSNSNTYTFNYLKSWDWTSNGSTASIDFSVLEPGPNGGSIDGGYYYPNVIGVSSTAHGTPPNYWKSWNWLNQSNSFADISKGYRLNMDMPALTAVPEYGSTNGGKGITGVWPTGLCKDILFTFNLDSITEPNYVMGIKVDVHDEVSIYLKKTTTGTDVEWSYRILGDTDFTPMYYNPDLSSNTYQLYMTEADGELRYVGAWSDSIGEAPALLTYPFTFPGEPIRIDFNHIDFWGRTPVMRVDRASVAAYEYKIIRDTTFNPFDFKANPVTKLTYVQEVGTSLEFGGITFSVEDGKITVDSQSVSLAGIQLSSTFNGNAYDNTINGKIVSTTLAPSSVVFNGDWVVQVTATAQKHVEKESTSWVPGKFAWNGVDDNFLIAGLITCMAARIKT